MAYYLNDMTTDTWDEETALSNEAAGCGSDCVYSASANLKSGVGFHLVAGADFAMSEKVALSLGLQYRILNVDLEEETSCVGTSCINPDDLSNGDFSIKDVTEKDLGGLDLKLGIKYLF